MRPDLAGLRGLETGLLRWSLATAVAVAAIVLILARTGDAVAALLGASLVVLLPGYLVFNAMRIDAGGDRIYALALVIGLGFLVTILGGVLLEQLPGGLSLTTWLLYFIGVAVITELVGFLRHRSLRRQMLAGDPERTPIEVSGGALATSVLRPRRAWSRPDSTRIRQFAALAVALLIAGSSLAIARAGLASQSTEDFTQFWMLPTATERQFNLGIRNLEGSSQTYRVDVEQNGVFVESLGSIQVESGSTFSATITVPGSGRVDAYLFRPDDPVTAYRSVSAWVPG